MRFSSSSSCSTFSKCSKLHSIRHYLASASTPGVLPRAPMLVEKGQLVLRLEGELAAFSSDRLKKRLNQLGKLIGKKSKISTS